MTSVSWIFNNFLRGEKDVITPTNVGKYYKVTSFSPTDSKDISDALGSSSSKVYLSDFGGVVSINGTRNFKNGLTGQTAPDYSSGSIISMSAGNNKYVFSKPFGYWGLYRKTENEMYLVYNPVPRPEVDNLIQAKGDSGMQSFKTDIQTACKENGATDPICVCVDGPEDDRKFCMDDLMGVKPRQDYQRLSPSTYNAAEEICGCANTKCLKDHPFNLKHYRKKIPCPSTINFSVCNSTIDAGRDLKAGNVNIEQKCGVNTSSAPSPTPSSPSPSPTPSSPSPSPTPAPIPTPSPTPSPTPTPYSPSPSPSPAPTPSPIPTPSSPTPSSSTPSTPSQSSPSSDNTMLYLIIGGVILLILVILIVVLLI